MNKRVIPFVALVLLTAGQGYAACISGSKQVFSCVTQRQKQIQVCESPIGVEYSYGPVDGRPEIIVRVPPAQVGRRQWSVAQRWVFRALDIPNGKTIYSVYWSIEEQNPSVMQEGGVNVIDVDTVIATVTCQSSGIFQDFDSVLGPRGLSQSRP